MVTKLSINVSEQCNFLDAHLLFITSNNYFASCNSQAAVVTDSLVSIYLPTYLFIYLSGSKGVGKSTLLSRHLAVKATIGEEDWRTAYFVSTTYILLLFQLFKYRLFVT